MTFKPRIWRPIAIGLSAVNLAAVGFAAAGAEGLHAAVHAGLALALGLWAQRMATPKEPTQIDDGSRFEALEEDVRVIRAELTEAQERIDFTERVLARDAEQRRVGGPEH
jgi:hypothetical protein